MSLALERVTPVTVHDPRVIQQQRVFPVLKGGEQVLYKVYTTSSVSNSSITFHCPPPSQNLYVDRCVHLRVPVRVTIPAIASGLVNDKYIVANGLFSLRSFPLQKALDTVQLTINNQSMSINIGDMLSALEHYNASAQLKSTSYSKCAVYPIAFCQEFNNLAGTVRSPLAPASSSIDQSLVHNAPFTVVSGNSITAANASAATVIDFVSTEALFISPLYWGDCSGNDSGFYGVKTMDFTFNFNSNAGNRMIAIDPLGIYSSDATARAIALNCVASFNNFSPAFSYTNENTPALLFQYITPQLVDRGNPMQQVLNYPYVNLERYPSALGSAATAVSSGVPAAAVTINSTNVQLNSIPTKLYIFARANNSQMEKNPYSPDSFCRLASLNLQWGNRSGLLASASMQQLYDISVRAGCMQSFADWAGLGRAKGAANALGADIPCGLVTQQYFGTGTVMAIDPIDLGLDSIDAPGKLDQITLQVNATWQWLSTGPAVGLDMYVVAVSAGVFTLFNGQASSLIGVLNSTDILNSHAQTESKMMDYFETKSIYGGGFLSDLKSNLRHLRQKKAAMAAGAGVCASASGGQRISKMTLAQRLA